MVPFQCRLNNKITSRYRQMKLLSHSFRSSITQVHVSGWQKFTLLMTSNQSLWIQKTMMLVPHTIEDNEILL